MPRTIEPKYIRTKQKLIRMIRSGRWPVGGPFPSETELLTQFDVSRPTLVRSLQDLVREGYLLRRQGQGTVVANYLRSAGARTLPLFVNTDIIARSGDDRHILNAMMSGVEAATAPAGCAVEVVAVPENTLDEEMRRRVDKLDPGGVLVYLPSVHGPLVKHLTEQGFAVWGLGEPCRDLDCVYIDEEACGYLATRYLLEHGRRRIALLNGPLNAYWGFRARQHGYLRALDEAGVEPDPRLMFERHHVLDSESGRAMVRDLLASGVGFDSVFGVTDRKAMGAIAALQEAGYDVPTQIGIVSMDDTLAERSPTPLSAVHAAFDEMARIAAARAIDSPQAASGVVSLNAIRIEPHLVDRGSAGDGTPATSA